MHVASPRLSTPYIQAHDHPLALCRLLGRGMVDRNWLQSSEGVAWWFESCFVPTDRIRTSSHSSVLMRKCWREDPEERPTFSQLSSIVERLLTSIAGYTELGMVLLNTIQEVEQLSK